MIVAGPAAEAPGLARVMLALARPRLAPAVLALPGLGFGFAHWDRALPLRAPGPLGALLLGWACLHVGTMWCNAALDRDEGPVLLGAAVPVPPRIGFAGHLALAAAVAVVAIGAPAAMGSVVGCAALAVLYSHPATAWKGHPIAGPLTNLVGYGLLSPWAGVSVVGEPLSARGVALGVVVGACVVGVYFVAQAFQGEEDQARGYRTLVATAGSATTLHAASLCFFLAFFGVGALAVIGLLPAGVLLTLVPGAGALWELRRNARLTAGGGPEGALRVARWLRRAVAVGMLALVAHYVADSVHGGPVAGQATRTLPSDYRQR